MDINTFIFDLGAVLIDWNPRYVFDQLIADQERRAFFFQNICTAEWNETQDAGRSLQEATETLVHLHPDWKNEIEAYYGRWNEMLGGAIPGSVEILKRLKASGKYRLYALTNWSTETFPVALERFGFLHWFDGRVVSGEEKMRKPFPEFYKVLLERFQVTPAEALFIDDNLRNIQGAQAVGIQTLQFHSAQQLEHDLKAMHLL